MLIAIGNTVASAQMYSNYIDDGSIEITNAQGNTDDTFKCQVWDPTSSFTIAAEDELHVIDETDSNGWPSCNLLLNGSFEGTYSGGMAPHWTMTSNKTTGTVTNTVSNTAFIYGASAQQTAVSNIDSAKYADIVQNVTLPTNENNASLLVQPYYFSCWYLVTAAFTAATLKVSIDWYDKNNTFISTVSSNTLTNPGVSVSWQRLGVGATAPSNATNCHCYVKYTATSATNSGTFVLDGAQFEYATFGSYQSNAFGVSQLDNFSLKVSGGATIADGWTSTGPTTGVTFAGATVNGSPGQSIACAATAASTSTLGIAQTQTQFNPLQNYTLSLSYAVTAALDANSQVVLGWQWQDVNGNPLTNVTVAGPAGEGVSAALESLSFPVGPNTGQPPPAGAVYCKPFAGIYNNSNAHTDTIFLDALTIVPYNNQQQPAYAGMSALQAGMYPTPYIDETTAGDNIHMVWQDREITNLYYRAHRIFGGYIRHAKKNFTQSTECYWDLDAVDFGVVLSEALIVLVVRGQNITYEPSVGMADNLAIAAACQYAHNQGYLKGIDWTSHVTNLTSIPAMSFNWVTVRDAMAAIADVTIAAYWVDPYRYLWYQAALSISSGFSVSITPDYQNSFPFEEWAIDYDSTQTRTTSVIQGSTQLSSPTTSQTMYAYVGTAQQALNANSTYSTCAISPNSGRISQNTGLQIGGTNGTLINTAVDILPTPAAALSQAAASGTSTFSSGNVITAYTYLYYGADGVTLFETAPSPTATTSVTGAGQVVNVSALTPPNSGTTNGSGLYGINVYVSISVGSGTLKLQTTHAASNGTVPAFSITGYGTGAAEPGTTSVTIPIQPITPSATTSSGATAQAARFTVNGGAPLYNVTQVTVGGVNQSVGMATATQTGYQCYADPQPAQITFDPTAYPSNNAAVIVTFTFENPVLVRVTNPGSTTSYTNGRLIAFYQNVTNIQSISDAIDQANAQLSQYSRAQPLGHLRLHWPPCPRSANPHQGQYITVYHPPSLGTQPIKFQIQRVTTKVLGNSILVRDFELGFYRPDFAVQMSQVTQDASHLASDLNASSVLNDVDTISDAWTVTDAVSGSVSNTAVWGTNNWNDATAFA